MVIFATSIFSVLSPKQLLIHNEELLVAVRSVGFVPFGQKTFGDTIEATFGARSEAIQADLQHFLSSQEALWSGFKKQHELLLLSLRSGTQMIRESCMNEMVERCAPLYEETVLARLDQQIELQLRALNAEHSGSRERGNIVTGFGSLVGDEIVRNWQEHQSTLIPPSILFPKEGIRE